MAAKDEQGRKRTPFSARLPQVPLSQAVPIAEALATLGTPATPHVIAQQMGTTYSSSAFKTKIAAAGYYGLTGVNGDRRTLSQRGEALTSGDETRARQARREAVMSTSFGPVIHSLRGRAVSEHTIALRLHSDLQVPEASSQNVAKALIESARHAELLTADDRFDAVAVEETAVVMPQIDETSARQRQTTPRPQREQRSNGETPATKPKPNLQREEETRPLAGGVQVVVRIDASSLTPQQIAELVRELQRGSS